jgi:ABC-type nitrate/sulfonate/bicarbonate transport system substrate-binding protein
MRIHRGSLFVVIAAMAIIVAACGPGASPAPGTTSGTTAAPAASGTAGAIAAIKAKVQGKSISLGAGSPPNLAEVTTLKATQILKDDFGVTVDYRPIQATAVAAGVVGGSLNIAEVSLTRLAGLKEGGADVLVIGTNDYKLDYVLAVKDPIKTIQDLRGQPYVDGGATGPSALFNDYCFGKAGMTVNDTRVTHLASSAAINSAFATDQFVGAMVHADTLANLQAKFPGRYRALCFTYEGVHDTNDVWFTMRQWATDNPDLTQAVILAKTMAARWTYENKDGWVKLANQYVPDLEPGVAAATYDLFAGQIGLWSNNGALDLAKCSNEMRTLVTLGRLKAAIDCSTFATTEYERKAVEVLGKVDEPKPKAP